MAKNIQRLTPEEFEALMPSLKRLSLGTIEVARAVLVEGKSQAEVVRETGKSKQLVSANCKIVLDYIEDVPRGWVKEEVCLPKDVMEEVRQIERRERAKLSG